MISQGTEEWAKFIFNLEFSKRKSNRDVLCIKCWEVLTYEQRAKHQTDFPEHQKNVLTSKWYGSENKFLTLARDLGKIHNVNGKEVIENPFKRKMRRKRQQQQMVNQRKQLDQLQFQQSMNLQNSKYYNNFKQFYSTQEENLSAFRSQGMMLDKTFENHMVQNMRDGQISQQQYKNQFQGDLITPSLQLGYSMTQPRMTGEFYPWQYPPNPFVPPYFQQAMMGYPPSQSFFPYNYAQQLMPVSKANWQPQFQELFMKQHISQQKNFCQPYSKAQNLLRNQDNSTSSLENDCSREKTEQNDKKKLLFSKMPSQAEPQLSQQTTASKFKNLTFQQPEQNIIKQELNLNDGKNQLNKTPLSFSDFKVTNPLKKSNSL